MKTKHFYLIVSFVFSFIQSNAQKSTPVADLQTSDWYKTAVTSLENSAFDIRSAGQNKYATNHKNNNMSIKLEPCGYSLITQNWQAKFVIESVGGKEAIDTELVSTEQPTTNALYYHYPAFKTEYHHTASGLRQNFVLYKKENNLPFQTVSIQIITALTASVKGTSLELKDKSGKVKLWYDDLRVWDATGRALNSRMELKKSNRLEIIVDDNKAIYPITIDPLNHTPEWETSAEGVLPALLPELQVEAAYGYSVTGLGDVNGDGYDDVAISAPTAVNIISNTSVVGAGAIYVYFGSASGLPATPSKVLRSNTPIANALFGYSVAGGDVTGDGKADIIVGAPLDSYETIAKGLLNNPTVTVTAGKVYVFRGEDISSNADPSPFLSIKLSGANFFSIGVLNLLQSNVSAKALFGFSTAVTEDLNGDGKRDIIIGAPGYQGMGLLEARSGAAYVYLSSDLSTTTPVSLSAPSSSLLGISLPLNNLLFGFSVDGVGDYNKDGRPDVVVGAPAGILNAGQLLSGSAYVYYGTGSSVSSSIGTQLIASSGLLSSVSNLFGYTVRGVRDAAAKRNGNIIAGAPGGSTVTNVASLQLKTGNLYVFKAKSLSAGSVVTADQNIPSPRNASLLSLLSNLSLDVTALFGAATDNLLDINCDGYSDIIVGEPLSTGVGLINANVAGGAGFIFLGKPDGSYNPSPYWTLTTNVSPNLGINAASLLGYSVAGAGYVKGRANGARALVGGPGRSLDFGSGLLNLGSTFSTLFSLTAGNNGIGKAYSFAFGACNDNEKDGIPDVLDVDDDNDGIPDRYEFAQSNNSYAQPSTDPSADDDSDGVPNYKDANYSSCGGLNAAGICILFDKDGDGIPNHFDLDSDNDGLQDVIEGGGHEANGDGRVDCSGNCDQDGDGLLSSVDLTTTTDTYLSVNSKLSNGSVPGTSNGRILDTDADGVPDFLDIDSDNDGIYDLIETGGADSNGDGRVDYSGSFSAVDADMDGWINTYDADTNNDGDVTDASEGTSKVLIISTDANSEGLADTWSDGKAPDIFPVDFDSDNRPNYRDLDSDSDGINDVLEAGGIDTDGNGLIGTGVPVANTDGYASTVLPQSLISTDTDINGDGRPDDDVDPYFTPYHNGGGGIPSSFNPDQDRDSRPNFLDLDSDNDGLNDILEGRIDRDANGTPDTNGQDTDGDGMIDNKTDVDRDGIADVVDFIDNQYGDGKSSSGIYQPVNTDGTDPNTQRADSDIVPDYLDLDSDNDGIFDTKEGGNAVHDANGDGIIDCGSFLYTPCDPDLDGILEKVDGKPGIIGDAPSNAIPNSDGTDTEDYRDLNSDNDNTNGNGNDDNFDTVENRNGVDEDEDNDGRVDGTDTDGDGIINIPSIDNNNVYGGNNSQEIPLPVHLISFNGALQNEVAQLVWLTENEIAFQQYELERSIDGKEYATIAVVLPYSDGTKHQYAYPDKLKNVNYNQLYYRLKMVDKDGKYTYSRVIVLTANKGLDAAMSIYPNPVISSYKVSLVGLAPGKYSLVIHNAVGQVKEIKSISISSSLHIENLERGRMSAGSYFITVKDKTGRQISSEQFIIR